MLQRRDHTTPSASAAALLERKLGQARTVLAWERVWPPVVAALSVAALFFAASWFGFAAI